MLLSPSSFCGSRRRAFFLSFVSFYDFICWKFLCEFWFWICVRSSLREGMLFFFVFWFPLVTQFSWPVECGHGIGHVICVQVSLGFFFWFFVCFFPFCVVLRSWDPACLFLALSVSFFAFFFLFCGCRRLLLPACVCVSVRAC